MRTSNPRQKVFKSQIVKRTSFEKANFIVGLVSLIITAFFSFIAYRLAVKTSENSDQITRLDYLIEEVATENKNLISTQEILHSQLDILKSQLTSSATEQKILSNQLTEFQNTNKIKLNQDLTSLYYSNLILKKLTGVWIWEDELKSQTEVAYLNQVAKIDSVIKNQQTNPIILMDSSLNSHWKKFIQNAEQIRQLYSLSHTHGAGEETLSQAESYFVQYIMNIAHYSSEIDKMIIAKAKN